MDSVDDLFTQRLKNTGPRIDSHFLIMKTESASFAKVGKFWPYSSKCYQIFNSYWRISTNPDTSKKKILPPETYAGVFYDPTELIYEEI